LREYIKLWGFVVALDKPKIVKVEDVEPRPVENAEGVRIRVLISSEEAPTYAMRVFEMDPGGHIPRHSHPWEHEIFVLRGVIRVAVGDRIFVVGPRTAIYIPPNVPHEYWCESNDGAEFICTIPNKPTA